MLRILFGEPPREWTGSELETVRAIEKFISLAYKTSDRSRDEKTRQAFRKYGIWAESLLRALDELEQSRYAAKRYGELVRHEQVGSLTPEETLHYHRHVYFDKNAYIRVFSILDKLGTLLNALLDLRTERMKTHFSYFTVLRNMRENRLHPELSGPLNVLKEKHREAFGRLRSRRNTEIHHMNAELQDDLRMTLSNQGDERRLEDLRANLADLDRAWEMIEASLGLCFRYACQRIGRGH